MNYRSREHVMQRKWEERQANPRTPRAGRSSKMAKGLRGKTAKAVIVDEWNAVRDPAKEFAYRRWRDSVEAARKERQAMEAAKIAVEREEARLAKIAEHKRTKAIQKRAKDIYLVEAQF